MTLQNNTLDRYRLNPRRARLQTNRQRERWKHEDNEKNIHSLGLAFHLGRMHCTLERN